MSEERDGERVTDRNQTLLLLDGLIQRDQFGYQLGSFPENLNVTLRNGNATEEIDSFYFYQTEQFTVLLLLFVMIVVGNIAVLIGLLWGKRRKTRMDFFIKQLAFADLLVGLINVLSDIILRITVTWYAGNVACKLIKFVQILVTYSSTYVLVALSIDRYDAITRPMNFTGRWWRARALVVAAWGVSAFFSVPMLFLYEEKQIQGKTQCWIELGSQVQWRIYMSLVSATLFIAPTLIIGGCYAVIVATIWTQGGALRQGPTRDTRRASSRGLIPRAKVKTVKMTLVIVFARGDPSFPDARLQAGRITPSKQEMTKQADALILERMQTKMRFLEDSNTVVQTRNQNLIAENKVLTSQLEDERSDVKILGKRMESLREELESEKSRVAEMKIAAMQRKNMPQVEANGTSTTNFVSRTDRGVQIWAVCMGCQRKLESCEKQPPIVVITKSELELLEKDMQTLRDTIIAREEAWDKAMEREQNYRQQLTRLTTETITARHLSETRYEELQTLSKTLLEKESELKSHQKDNQCLNKLIVKLYNGHQSCRGQDESKKSNVLADINEKDQKFIEEIVRRVSSAKSKQKPKAKSARSEKNANCSAYQTTSRDKSARPAKDQTGLSRDVKR